jgi:hypothetical protein
VFSTSFDGGLMRRGPSRRRSILWLAIVLAASAQLSCQGTPPPAPPPQAEVAAPPSPASRQAPPAEVTAAADRYDLGRDESRGGHTLARHVGRTDADLRERLRRERQISAASTYTDRATAERVVARTLSRNRARVDQWLARQGSRPNLALDYRGEKRQPIGRSIMRRSPQPFICTDAVVVLRGDGPRAFIVLTSYPEVSR